MGAVEYALSGGILGAVGLPLWVVLLAAYVFVFCRSWVYYYGGRLVARGATKTRFAEVLRSPKYSKASSALNRYGAVAVALSFLVLGTGTAMTVGAGFLGMNRIRFLIAVIPGSAAWAVTRAAVGLAAVDVVYFLATRNRVALVAVALALAVLVGAAVVLLRRRR